MSLIPPAAPTRFDMILFFVGATLLTGGIAGVLSTIPLYIASAVSSLIASVALFDGMVRNPPVE